MGLPGTKDPLKVKESCFIQLFDLRNDLIMEINSYWEKWIFEIEEPSGHITSLFSELRYIYYFIL